MEKEISPYLLFIPIIGGYFLTKLIEPLKHEYCLKNSYSGSKYEFLFVFFTTMLQIVYFIILMFIISKYLFV